jgi:predicted DNA-binding protein (UPF0251 family)
MNKEIVTTVNSAVQALPEELRTAITLREMDGLSYEEIAQVMNCPIGTVRSRIFRAREAIAAELRPLLDTAKTEGGRYERKIICTDGWRAGRAARRQNNQSHHGRRGAQAGVGCLPPDRGCHA